MIIVVLDTSIKNNITTFIAYIHLYLYLIKKTLYYTINITSTKTELFTIRCSINQAVQFLDIKITKDRLSFILFSFLFFDLFSILELRVRV